MGVMGCYRPGCDGIMCDVYVSDVGYVCWECEKEFTEYIEMNFGEPMTEGEIKRELQKFMSTRKGQFEQGKEINIYDFFNEHRRQ